MSNKNQEFSPLLSNSPSFTEYYDVADIQSQSPITDGIAAGLSENISRAWRNPRNPNMEPDICNIYSYLGESVIVSVLSGCCLFTLPIALFAVYNAAQVDANIIRGKPIAALGYSRTARILMIVGASGTLIAYTAVFLLFIQLLGPI